jgi:hypothetical protein
MAKAKKTRIKGKARGTAPVNTKAKALQIPAAAVQYVGFEPVWEGVEVTEASRKVQLMGAFNWYNYNFGAKEANAFLVEYLTLNDRKDDAKLVKKAKDAVFSNAVGYLARMTLMGWELDAEEAERIEQAVVKAKASAASKQEEVADPEKPVKAKFNIQDHMREKSLAAGGELEGMLDDYIAAGAKARHKFAPIAVLKEANILPAHAAPEIDYWTGVLAEFKEVYAGKDKELNEAYAEFGKIQLRNIIKFIELIIADYHGYVAFKKATKKVTKRKVRQKTPEQLAIKMKFLAEFKELNLTSIKPAKIVGAKEVFAYDTKKRKLMYFIADEYAQTLTVKNNTIVGFDVNKSAQKTVRKPKEQIKALMAASIPNTRKLYKNTKAVEIKVSGRMSENIVLLKVK